ncbi:MAG: hypothetical protein GXP55_22290 [Deltaproteobacteria bacterium]|nr:hypothetical protein [Deltaproteobacteria bacterium]
MRLLCRFALHLACVGSLLCCVSSVSAQGSAQTPAHNRASLQDPPPRPAASEASERARAFLLAVRDDDAEAALAFFLPRDAFRLIKGVTDPDRFYDRLVRRFRADLHALHQAHPELAEARFLRVELSRRRGWVRPRQEANRLPYWSVRHSRLVYEVAGQERSFELRTLITWDDHWYLTHLGEFH